MREIQLREAKAGFSAVVDSDETLPLNESATFASLLMNAPLEPEDIPARDTRPLRGIDF